MAGVTIKGYIYEHDGDTLTVVAPFSDGYLLDRRQITECEIRLDDGRTISAAQRRHIYATMRDIADYTGYAPEQVKAIWKYNFIAQNGTDYFSLSDCDMTTANEYLNFLIEFCLEHDIPTLDSLLERSPDISRYLYFCIANKKCCLCGKPAELHHVDRVGAGRDRKEITHAGMRAEALCRVHHTEAHNTGQQSFDAKYHIYGIKLDQYLCGVLKINGR